MLKKIISFFIVCLICVSFSVPVFAAETTIQSSSGKVTLSEVVSTEKKTLTIDGEKKEVTIYYIPIGCDIKIDVPADCTSSGEGHYMEVSPNVYEFLYAGQGIKAKIDDEEGFDVCPLITFFPNWGEEVYCMLAKEGQTTPVPDSNKDETPVPDTDAAPAPAEPKPQETSPVSTVPTGESKYVVKYGDTLGKISLNFYGSYTYHTNLYRANKDAFDKTNGRLNTGMELIIPANIGNGIVPQPKAGDGEVLYTVKAGDTLGTISQNYYGSSAKYKVIFERNTERIKNANLIYEGQIIVLPKK